MGGGTQCLALRDSVLLTTPSAAWGPEMSLTRDSCLGTLTPHPQRLRAGPQPGPLPPHRPASWRGGSLALGCWGSEVHARCGQLYRRLPCHPGRPGSRLPAGDGAETPRCHAGTMRAGPAHGV